MDKEQRTYSRVAARLKGLACPVESADLAPRFRTAPRRDGATPPPPMQGLPEGLIEFLLEMDAKLDQILVGQRQDQLRQDYPLELDIREISGAGVRFSCSEPLAEGQALELVIVLNQYPLRLTAAVGRVRGEEGGLRRFEFTYIREHDLETIVQFVFQEQREEIRNRKWG